MTILVDSDEYKCWHEVGHATVCLQLGGDVECIEFLSGDERDRLRGYARARCIVMDEIHKDVACGGFATEFILSRNRFLEQASDDKRPIDWIILHNAAGDRRDFWGRRIGSDDEFTFTKEEDQGFVDHAVGANGSGGVVAILIPHFHKMRALVRELCDARRVEGRRIKELLRIDTPRKVRA